MMLSSSDTLIPPAVVLEACSPLHLSTYLSTRVGTLAKVVYHLHPRLLDVVVSPRRGADCGS
ncbi:hypothetical protein IG631_00933 [Alternaria alternata]|nr:hypothetical protein IG631_00933 [Alternaria alternata]